MWRKTTSLLLLCGVFALSPALVRAQDTSEGVRKVLVRKPPKYPELARRMGISGSVKLEVAVSPNGIVKSMAIKGGHPLLAQAAQDTIRDWKWEPSSHETRELIEVKFDNPQGN